jgi:hypothetical protein
MTEQEQLTAAQHNGNSIEYIVDPSEHVQLAAIQQNPRAIKWIKNPCVFAQLMGEYD